MIKFEWDEAQRSSNIRKHGIDFVDALPLFEGFTLTIEDTRFPYDEQRYIPVGLVQGRAIVVAHTERGERIRIISARKATKHEEIAYFQQIADRLESPRRAKGIRH